MQQRPYSQSINLNVNLINFPEPIQLSINQKMAKSSLQEPKSKHLKNNSLTINKKQSPLSYENFEDSMEEFHPTMSTQSLRKVKKMYEKTIKTKGFGKSLDDFLHADVQDIIRKNSKSSTIKESDPKILAQNKSSSRQNTYKSNQTSQNSSNNNSRNSTEHLVSKEPIEELECYDTFQEDQDFIKFDHIKKESKNRVAQKPIFSTDAFKKNKTKEVSKKQPKSQKDNIFVPSVNDFKPFSRSKQLKLSLHQQENKPFLNNVSRSNSKSRSKSKQKSREKPKNEILKKLPSAKNIKSLMTQKKQTKSPLRINTSKSPFKNCSEKRKGQEGERSKSKSKSKSKKQKTFVRSNIQIQISNHQTFSPSPMTKRGSKSKSFQRSRSKSQRKSHSKQKKSISKSVNSKNVHINKSPKKMAQKKKIVKQFHLKSTDFPDHKVSISREINKSRSASKQKHKGSVMQDDNTTLKEKVGPKKIIDKNKMSKQLSQQVLKSSDFSKTKLKKLTYVKPEAKTSTDHSRSTNFYLPERKESIKQKNKTQKDSRAKKLLNQKKNKSKTQDKNKASNQKSFSCQQLIKFYNSQQVFLAVQTIQRIYRGYRVRKQLNDDLRQICSNVDRVRSKIEDKKSKYWLNANQQKQTQNFRKQKKLQESSQKIHFLKSMKQNLKIKMNKEEFESILSSSNSIQQIEKNTEEKNKSLIMDESDGYNQPISNQMSRSITMQRNQTSQLKYFEQMVNKDLEQNEKFLKESEQLKQHIRSISSEHLKGFENGIGAKIQEENLEGKQQRTQHQKDGKSLELEKKNGKVVEKIEPENSKPALKLSQLGNNNAPIFEFYQAYSPKHYIVSPRNPSPSALKMVSPISSSSSFYQHNQVPFSLQSPQNILNGENFKQYSKQEEHDDEKKLKYFEAANDKKGPLIDDLNKQNKICEKQEKFDEQVQKKMELLKKLFYEDKLLSPKTFEHKLSLLKSKSQIKQKIVIEQKSKPQQEEVLDVKVNDIEDLEKSSIGKKMKLTELTEKLNKNCQQLQKEGVSRALFTEQSQIEEKEFDFKPQINQLNQKQDEEIQNNSDDKQSNYQLHQGEIQENNQQQEVMIPVSHRYQRCGFATELIFIKNYIFQFFSFVKSNPLIQKQLLLNLLSVPYQNDYLLTCYRTQLNEIDADYYENKIQGSFLAYPYWKNLIQYEPIIGTDVFQRFSQFLQERNKNDDPDEESENYFCVSQEQERKFFKNFRNERISLKEIQRIFLMMLMDAFNQAFEQERCSYRQLGLIKHEKGGMSNEHVVRQALRKTDEIEKLQKSIPTQYLQPDQIQSHNLKDASSHQSEELQGSQNYQFFVIHSLRQKKQELIDVIFCSVLKRVLENWGRSMCGLIIEPEQEDEMQITNEQIQIKNTERLCLTLNKYVEEYQKELGNVMREHQLCTKLIVSDKVLEALLEQLVREISIKI